MTWARRLPWDFKEFKTDHELALFFLDRYLIFTKIYILSLASKTNARASQIKIFMTRGAGETLPRLSTGAAKINTKWKFPVVALIVHAVPG